MKKKYGELNLRDLREKADLDFAHFTYKRGMSSCIHSPRNLPKKYWRDRFILPKDAYDFKEGDKGYTFLLFKNSDNGNGIVTKKDYISNYTCVEWGFPFEKLDLVCSLLQEQLGEDYYVEKPDNQYRCIVIYVIKEQILKMHKRNTYLRDWISQNSSSEECKEDLERYKRELSQNEILLKELEKCDMV